MHASSHALCLSFACLLPLALTGCTLSPTAVPSPDAGLAIRGLVHGGQQAIVGAHVYLFAANTTGYGNASVSLLTNVPGSTTLDSSGGTTNGDYYVTTGANGAFGITGDYTCAANSQVYLYALGGNPGAGTNAAAGLLAALGSCPVAGSFSSSLFIVVNEVSTVAAAYALAGFATDATHVSSSGTALALTGIANAFANAANLETLSTGLALATTPSGNGTAPRAEIDTLANVLAACVNSTGAGSTTCTTLFANAKSGGSSGTAATDTATAAINIAHNPAANIANLYALAASTPPFAPGLTSQPNDWTVELIFSGGALNFPWSLAVDAAGAIWVTNYSGNSITKLSSSGAILSGASGYTGGGLNTPEGIAIDHAGNAWVANHTGNSVVQLSNSGTILSGTGGYTGGGLNAPQGIAMDGSDNAWVGSRNSIVELSSSGTFLSGSNGYTVTSGAELAVDGSGNVWIPLDSEVVKLSNSGSLVAGSPYTGGGLCTGCETAPVVIDASGDAWVKGISSVTGSIVELSNSGSILSGTAGYTGGGLLEPWSIAVDGAGDAWVADFQNNCVDELSKAGAALSPASGFVEPGLSYPTSIAVDGSGNVWVLNSLYAGLGSVNVTEFVGAGTPVITPIAAGLPATPTVNGTSNLGTRP